jgi:hypothetical protein
MALLPRSTPFLGVIALLGCSGQPRMDPGATADDQAADAGSDQAGDGGCVQWGPIGLPWATGTYALETYGFGRSGPYLVGAVDAMKLVSSGGHSEDCSLTELYLCESPHSGGKIIATFRDQHWSWPARCPQFEDDAVQLNLDGVACVEAGTVVLEGDLSGVDPARATPSVILTGPWQRFASSGDPVLPPEEAASGHLPAIECSVDAGHYRCPTLGFATTARHTLLVGGLRTELELEVSDCSATKTTLDVACPSVPVGFYVEISGEWGAKTFRVEASYEGGAPQPCVFERELDSSTPTGASRAANKNSRFLCPPAAGDEWGRGHYEIVATSPPTRNEVKYASNVTDVFDGCGGTAAPIMLRRLGSPE